MLPAFDIRLDNPVKGKEYLSIGDDCIVSGKFIFESKEGKISIGNHSYLLLMKLMNWLDMSETNIRI